MPENPTRRVSGVIATTSERAYEGFVSAGDGRTVGPGVTRTLWVVEDPQADPVAIRIRDEALWRQVRMLEPFSAVTIDCMLYPNGRGWRVVGKALVSVQAEV
ncbi:MAG: hypothetical protein IT198_16610 [Acidimicrobiia bacterium]|nr:hypothetical protein [Acidimicrobiia bacterium]